MEKIFELKIALKGSKPPIWRKVLVSSNLPLLDLSYIIMTTMGWTHSHLHGFYHGKRFIDGPNYETGLCEYDGITIDMLLKKLKDKITFLYDFGDDWKHAITLVKIHDMDKSKVLPICISGKRACPPEDCGGIHRYSYWLSVLKDPTHEEYEEAADWFDVDNFDSEKFDIDYVNKALQQKDYGVLSLF